MKRIGIYSGSFDPVHNGHLAFAHEAIKQCGLDKVFFLVEPRPRRKQGVKALEHRTEMVRLAIKDEPKFGSLLIDQQRFSTTETLPLLLERFKGISLYLLMGDDVLWHLTDWPHLEDLTRHVRLIIGLRRHKKEEVRHKLQVLQKTKGFGVRYDLLHAENTHVTSSSIRQNIRSSRSSADLPKEVLEYIEENNLYAVSTSGSK